MEKIKVYYLILDKSNKVVAEKKTKEDAELYVQHRPYLRYVEFIANQDSVKSDLDDMFK
jgi:hypothetical protein